MVFNFYLSGGLFLRNCKNLPWPVKNNFIPCGFSQEERRCVMLSWGKFGHRRKEEGMLPIGKMIPLQWCNMVTGAAQRDSGSVLPQRKLPSQSGEESTVEQGFTCPQGHQSPWNILSSFQQTWQGDFGQAKYSHVHRNLQQGGIAWRISRNSCVCSRKAKLGLLGKNQLGKTWWDSSLTLSFIMRYLWSCVF